MLVVPPVDRVYRSILVWTCYVMRMRRVLVLVLGVPKETVLCRRFFRERGVALPSSISKIDDASPISTGAGSGGVSLISRKSVLTS